MTKEEFIAMVKEKLAGGDAPSQLIGIYHPNVIAKYLEMAFNDLIFQAYAQGQPSGDFSQVDNYIQRYKCTPAYNSESDEWYITLPVQPVPLPNNFAIRQLSALKDQLNVVFEIIDTTAQRVFEHLEVSRISTIPRGYYEGNRIYFDSDSYPVGLENLLLKMIVGFAELADNDQVFVPSGNNTMVFEKVCQLMLKAPKVNQDDMTTKQV